MMEQPFVSVIMPIRNEAGYIARSLGAVLAQDYPHDCLEVLVADGMSDDRTRHIVGYLAARSDVRVTLVDNPGKVVPTGFNRALQQARGEIIVRVDGHTIIAPDYVRECVAALARSGADNVGGRMNAVSKTELGAAIAHATSSPFGVGGARFHYSDQEEWVDTVYMGAWPRAVFERIGGFDEEMVRNQDDEFNYRLQGAGGKILLSSRIQSTYFNRSDLRSLWRQYYQYGMYKVRVLQKHPRQMRPRQFAPPLLAGAVVGGAALALLIRPLRGLWRLGSGVYLAANLLASLWMARKHGWHLLRYYPLIFAALHFGYGLGFLRGLVKFADRWER